MSPPQITSPLEPDYSQREIAANCPCAVTLSSALTANLSFYSNESALSPALPETLAPSFGTGRLQLFNIPFVPSKSRLDVWVSNCEFCPEIGSIDDLATGTAIPLVFATIKTVMVLVVHLLATVAKCLGPGGPRAMVAENLRLTHQLLILSRSRQLAPNLFAGNRFFLNSCPRDALIGFSVTGPLPDKAKHTTRPTSRTRLPN